jgi:hypothetical protein
MTRHVDLGWLFTASNKILCGRIEEILPITEDNWYKGFLQILIKFFNNKSVKNKK